MTLITAFLAVLLHATCAWAATTYTLTLTPTYAQDDTQGRPSVPLPVPGVSQASFTPDATNRLPQAFQIALPPIFGNYVGNALSFDPMDLTLSGAMFGFGNAYFGADNFPGMCCFPQTIPTNLIPTGDHAWVVIVREAGTIVDTWLGTYTVAAVTSPWAGVLLSMGLVAFLFKRS